MWLPLQRVLDRRIQWELQKRVPALMLLIQ